ncbi:MAG: helix-turn-helix domain-containing protein [Treponema sp.]|nr:helix-turn-helix domain-containing protein [Treponema sp.]
MLEENTTEELTRILPAILTVEEAATFLNCSTETIIRLIKRGKLCAYRVKEEYNRWNINRLDMLKYLAENTNI